jgi:hypothetical protein
VEFPIDTKASFQSVSRPDNVSFGIAITVCNVRNSVDLYGVENGILAASAITGVEVSRFTIVFEHAAKECRR